MIKIGQAITLLMGTHGGMLMTLHEIKNDPAFIIILLFVGTLLVYSLIKKETIMFTKKSTKRDESPFHYWLHISIYITLLIYNFIIHLSRY